MFDTNIKKYLDNAYKQFNQPGFIPNDPISIPHKFTKKEDIEIAGFISATLAWGNRKAIISSANKFMDLMENSPADFIANHSEKERQNFSNFVYRTFQTDDTLGFLSSLQNIYKNLGGLENIFTEGFAKGGAFEAINHFHETFFSVPMMQRTRKHVAYPAGGSAAKRINMYLRWMVRDDENGVDFGLWKKIDKKELMCPLDVHSGNSARKIGLLTRKQNDWKAVVELTENLKLYDKNDPVKYDFALFGMGVEKIDFKN